MLKKIALTCLIAVLSMGALAKSGYYRWLDDHGQPHFTQRPPVDRPSIFIPTGSTYRDDGKKSASVPPAAAKTAENTPAATPPQQLEILPDKDPERCTQAKNALQSLSRGQRVRVTDDKGEARILDKAEMNSQKETAQELIKVYC